MHDQAATLPAMIADFVAETEALHQALRPASEADWRTLTTFKDWSVYDHVGHLCISDRAALAAVTRPDAFRAQSARRMALGLAPVAWRTRIAETFGPVSGAELLGIWRADAAALAEALAAQEPRARLPWYGPDMHPLSFATARLMETWAHGRSAHDALGAVQQPTDRLRHICRLGFRTMGFAFMVRGMAIPAEPAQLELSAPDGAVWTYGEAGAANVVRGSAEDFCLVVCQCRNVADTALQVQGPVAAQWMAIAQYFVGGVSDPPAPGSR
jgi:uncharacterized protein (TIGR03084 family)